MAAEMCCPHCGRIIYAELSAEKKPAAAKEPISGVAVILAEVAMVFSVTVDELKGRGRPKSTVLARQIAMYLIRKLRGRSYPEIAQDLGGKDHTTAIYAFRKITKAVEQDKQLAQKIKDLEQSLAPLLGGNL